MYFEEGKDLGLKENIQSNFLKTVSAYANYHDGKIIFGIKDDKEVIGVSDVEKGRLSIENAINDNIFPRPTFLLGVERFEEKELIVLKVFKGNHPPYQYKKKAYQRQDSTTVEVDNISLQL
ncbi:MAG: ATP-binding protein [Streptococcaceae bacterium]|nr:ATP-binding protein [Streptococcaceae bacterium]